MKQLSEERTNLVFEKLTKYIGANVNYDQPDGTYCFQEKKDRVYYISQKILSLGGTVTPDNLLSLEDTRKYNSNRYIMFNKHKIWVKPLAEQQFLYGNHIVKSVLVR